MTLIAEKSKTEKTSSNNVEMSSFSFLKPVRLKQVSFWDVVSNVGKINATKYKCKQVKLQDLIKQRKGFFTIDDETEYKRCKVQLYARGVVLRDIVKGKEIKTKKQQSCKEDDFLVAEIDAKVGGYGIVPKELENAVVSSHYYLYEIDKRQLLPEFLGLYVKTVEFSSQVKASGSTNYASIRPNQVLEYFISLPPIDSKKANAVTQKTLIENYNAKISQAEANEQEAEELEKGIEKYLLKELGIEIKEKEKMSWKGFTFLQHADLKDLSRWSVDFLNSQDALDNISKGKYEIVRFNRLITFAQYGISEKSTETKEGFPMLRMNNIFEGELALKKLKYVNLSNEKIDSLLLKKDDFLFNRTNSKELVGKTAVFDVDGEYTFASYLIRLRINKEKANIQFINYLFNSSIIRKQIDIISRQVLGQANVNLTELKNFLIPLPPLKIQDKMVRHINSEKDKIKQLKSDAEDLRKDAKADFEAELFEK